MSDKSDQLQDADTTVYIDRKDHEQREADAHASDRSLGGPQGGGTPWQASTELVSAPVPSDVASLAGSDGHISSPAQRRASASTDTSNRIGSLLDLVNHDAVLRPAVEPGQGQALAASQQSGSQPASQQPGVAGNNSHHQQPSSNDLTFPPCTMPSGSVDLDMVGLEADDGLGFSYPGAMDGHDSLPEGYMPAEQYDDADLMNGYGYPEQEPEPAAVDEQETLDMLEVVNAAEKAQDPLLFLEQGVQKLGDFMVPERLVLSALRVVASDPLPPSRRLLTGPDALMGGEHGLAGALLLTEGHSHADERKFDWKSMWMDKLQQLADRAPATQQEDAGWSDVAVTLEASVVVVKDAAAKGSPGVLRQLLPRFKSGAVPEAVFALPAVQAVISFKWSRFARGALLVEVSVYILWLVCHCTFSLLLMDESADVSLSAMMTTSTGIAALASSAASNVAMLVFIYGEVCVLKEYGWADWFGIGNTLDMMSYGLQVLVSVLHLTRWPVAYGWFSCLVSAQHVLLWGKLVYYTRVFESTRDFRLIETVRLVLADAGWLLILLTATMMGFGFAFYTLYKQDREDGTAMYYQDHTSLSHSLYSTFMYLLAMFDMSVFYQASHPVAATLLFICYSMLAAIFLLNVLVAAMTASYQKVRAGEALRLLQYQAQVIDEVESQLPRWVQRDSWFPSYLHVLRVAPAPSYEVDPRHLWTGTRKAEDVLLAAHKESCERMAGLELLVEDLLTNAERTLMAVMQMAGASAPLPRTPSSGTPGHHLSRTSSAQMTPAVDDQAVSREGSGATAHAGGGSLEEEPGAAAAAPSEQLYKASLTPPAWPAVSRAPRTTRTALSQLTMPALAYLPAYAMKPRGASVLQSSRPPQRAQGGASSLARQLYPSLSSISQFQSVLPRTGSGIGRRSAPMPAYTTASGLLVQPGLGVQGQMQPTLVHLPAAAQRLINPRLVRSARAGREVPVRGPGPALGGPAGGDGRGAGGGAGPQMSGSSFSRRGWVVRGQGPTAPLPAVGLLLPGSVPLAAAPMSGRLLHHYPSRDHHDGADESEWTSVMEGPDDRDDVHVEHWQDQPISPRGPSSSSQGGGGPDQPLNYSPPAPHPASLITPHPSLAYDAPDQQGVTSPSFAGYLPRLHTIPEAFQASHVTQPSGAEAGQGEQAGRRTGSSAEYSRSSAGGVQEYDGDAAGAGGIGNWDKPVSRRSWHASLSGVSPAGGDQGAGGQHTTLALHPLVSRRSAGTRAAAGDARPAHAMSMPASLNVYGELPAGGTPPPPPGLHRASLDEQQQAAEEEEEEEESYRERQARAWVGALPELGGQRMGIGRGDTMPSAHPQAGADALPSTPSRQRLRRMMSQQQPVFESAWTAPVAWVPAVRVAETVARLRARALAHRRRRAGLAAAAVQAGTAAGVAVAPSSTPAGGTPAEYSRRHSAEGGREVSWQSTESQGLSSVSGLASSRQTSRHRLASCQLTVNDENEVAHLGEPLLSEPSPSHDMEQG